jgi:hypothetical protein
MTEFVTKKNGPYQRGNCDKGQVMFAFDKAKLNKFTSIIDPMFAMFDLDDNKDLRLGEFDGFGRAIDDFSRGRYDGDAQEFVNKIFAFGRSLFNVCDSDKSGGCTVTELFATVEEIIEPFKEKIPGNGKFDERMMRNIFGWSAGRFIASKCPSNGGV